MEIRVTVKQLGKKKPVIAAKNIEINCNQSLVSLKELLELIVFEQVSQYNEKNVDFDDQGTASLPQKKYLEILTQTGKAGFGNIYNENKVDLKSAQENVIQCYEDGIIAVFHGEEEITSLSQSIDLKLDMSFTFIRLTFLAGSIW